MDRNPRRWPFRPAAFRASQKSSGREVFGKSRGVSQLAAARIFLFSARDIWFVVGLPVFLYVNGWSFLQVGV